MIKKIFSILLIFILSSPIVYATTQLETYTQYLQENEEEHKVYIEVWEYNVQPDGTLTSGRPREDLCNTTYEPHNFENGICINCQYKKPATPGTIILEKTLLNDIWHIFCDVMEGITFQAGGGFWKEDVIMNPDKILSKEGHRSNKCGDANHWIIWVDKEGKPFRMDEIKSGATGGTLPTMIFQEKYSPVDLGFSNWSELQPEMVDKIELYKENFKTQKDITTVVPGERIYWTTWNGNQRWYHSGIPYLATPTFIFYIDYYIVFFMTLFYSKTIKIKKEKVKYGTN